MMSRRPGSHRRETMPLTADLRRLQERRRWKRVDPDTPSVPSGPTPDRHSTSSPELLDSTSNLLSALHLNGMGQMRSDPVLEVPDTPDRPARLNYDSDTVLEVPDSPDRPARVNYDSDTVLEVPDSPDRPARVNYESDTVLEVLDSPEQSPSGRRNPPRSRRTEESDTHLVGGGSSSAGNDAERMRKQAGLKRLISKALDTKGSPEPPCRKIAKTVDQSRAGSICVSSDSQSRGSQRENRIQHGESGNDVERKHRDKGKEVDLITNPRDNVFPTMEQSCLGTNGGLARCNRGKSIVHFEVDGRKDLELLGGDTSSSLAGISDQDMSRRYAAKNNARNTSGEGVGEDLQDRISIVSLEAVDRNKGKLKMDDNTTQSRPRVEARARPDRESWRSDKDVTVISDGEEASISIEDSGWRTTPNHTRKAQSYSSDGIVDAFKREDTNNHLLEKSYEVSEENKVSVNLVHDRAELAVSHDDLNTSSSRASSESESARRRHHRRQELSKRKDQYNSLRSISGESSSSVFQDLDTLYPQSSGLRLSSRTTLDFHDRGTVSGPVIDLDEEHSPEGFSSPEEQSFADDYYSRQIDDYSRQVESDEIFARQLQEQFYQESSGPGGITETDATIAWSLQEEDARRPTPVTRSQSQHRDAAMAHLYRDYSRWSRSALTRARVSAQLANLAQAPTSELQVQLRRAFNNPELDLETRFEFMEALENAFDDSSNAVDFNFQRQRDFNEGDYEMLLALDDHNHEHVGATEVQINSLPDSVIQMDGTSEACVICLDPPSVGDVVRHLPCLHKFHKECIDTWLRRKAACPICKSGIIT